MKYLSSEYDYAPTLLLIDSPILSLKEGKNNKSKNEIPNIDYKNIHIVRFTHNEHEGRYGLLYGVTD